MTEETQNIQEKVETVTDTKEIENEQSPEIKTEENQNNWKKFREQREQDRKALKEAEERARKKEEEAKALKEAMDAILNKNHPTQQIQQNDDYGYNYEEDENKRIEKLISEALERDRRKQQEENAKKEAQLLPQKLNEEFKDFSEVCNNENFDYLDYHHPEISKAFEHMPDSYDKWASVYKTIKKLVPYSNKKEDEKRIERNMMKPQAISSGPISPY